MRRLQQWLRISQGFQTIGVIAKERLIKQISLMKNYGSMVYVENVDSKRNGMKTCLLSTL